MTARNKALSLVAVCCLLVAGCSEANSAKRGAFGEDATVTLYSGGEVVRTWESDGRVLPETQSDGWYFKDKSTGKLVRVSGTVVIEYADAD